jgi:hypothetical protein
MKFLMRRVLKKFPSKLRFCRVRPLRALHRAAQRVQSYYKRKEFIQVGRRKLLRAQKARK